MYHPLAYYTIDVPAETANEIDWSNDGRREIFRLKSRVQSEAVVSHIAANKGRLLQKSSRQKSQSVHLPFSFWSLKAFIRTGPVYSFPTESIPFDLFAKSCLWMICSWVWFVPGFYLFPSQLLPHWQFPLCEGRENNMLMVHNKGSQYLTHDTFTVLTLLW